MPTSKKGGLERKPIEEQKDLSPSQKEEKSPESNQRYL
jgi:hypothetical protein